MSTPSTPATISPFAIADGDDPSSVPAFIRRREQPVNGMGESLLRTMGATTPRESDTLAPVDASRAVAGWELDHLKESLARKYLPTWTRRLLGWVFGIEDQRAIHAELAVMRDHGGKRLTDLANTVAKLSEAEAHHVASLKLLATQQQQLTDAIESRIERDALREQCAKLLSDLRTQKTANDHLQATNQALNAVIEDNGARYDAACRAYEDRIQEMRRQFAAIHDTAALLDLKAAFTSARTETAPKKLEQALAALEKSHATLATYAESFAHPFPEAAEEPPTDPNGHE